MIVEDLNYDITQLVMKPRDDFRTLSERRKEARQRFLANLCKTHANGDAILISSLTKMLKVGKATIFSELSRNGYSFRTRKDENGQRWLLINEKVMPKKRGRPKKTDGGTE